MLEVDHSIHCPSELPMENTEVTLTTTTTLPISGIHDQQHRFPTHDDHLQLIIAHQIGSPDHQEIISTQLNANSAEDDPINPHNLQIHATATLLLRYYAAVLGIVYLRHTGRFPIANPFMIFSIVAFGMAYLVFDILSCMTTHDQDSEINSSNSRVGLYRILKGVYYILSGLAFFYLLPILFTTA
ncbi:hypothetical protein E3N88_36437 [Mikania micrantha]|uniref:Uncharacterized protein n=1 Tax=Mikania micrantha TaxID=192012 RepID=A0A5N6M3W1_9ASTR|nr:hypothetical protein E3N88_36437 [Mikania micrantha]